MWPALPGRSAPGSDCGMAFARECEDRRQLAGVGATDAVGVWVLDSTSDRSICASATAAMVAALGASHSTVTRGAWRCTSASTLGSSVGAKSAIAARNRRVLVAGLNGAGGDMMRWTLRRIGRTSATRLSANGLGAMPLRFLTSKGSPTCSRRRASEWLMAEGVRASRAAARVTLPSVISTSKVTSRFRSIRES